MTDFTDIAAAFNVEGAFLSCEPHGSGHIHDTYLLKTTGTKQNRQYILQRLNTYVFRKPEALQDNLHRILEYLHQNASSYTDEMAYPVLLDSGDGNNYTIDRYGNYWRCYKYIEDSHELQVVENPEQAYEGGRLFGLFGARLKNYNPRRLHITIPDFLNIEVRLRQLMIAQLANPAGRFKHASAEFGKVMEHQLISRDFTRMRLALPDRAKNQLKLLESFLEQEEQFRKILEKIS